MYWSLLGFCEKLPHLMRPLSLRARKQKLVLPRLIPRASASWRWVQPGFCSTSFRSLRCTSEPTISSVCDLVCNPVDESGKLFLGAAVMGLSFDAAGAIG